MHRSALASIVAVALGIAPMTAADPAPAPAPAADQNDRITIEVSDRPLETVLQWISRRAGINIVCYEQEQPRVTLRLANVTWRDALENIAAKYDLVIEKTSDRVWVLARPPKVRMEFQDASLAIVLEALARQAGVNIVMASDVVGGGKKLTMTLDGVPWQEALDVIVKTADLAWIKQDYDIIRIVSPGSLSKDQQTAVIRLNYTKATDIKVIVDGLLKSDGTSTIDGNSNSLVINATPNALAAARNLIAEIDARTREVLIEMRFVKYSTTDVKALGFDPFSLNFNWEHVGNIGTTLSPFGTSTAASVFTRAASAPGNSSITGASLAFEAIASLTSTDVLQAPQILTLDNKQADMVIGREIHFAEEKVTTENGQTVRSLQEAATSPVKDGITIKVTPHITSDGFVAIDLEVSNENATLKDFVSGTGASASKIQLPTKDTTQLKATIMVANNRTAVIGGLLDNKVEEQSGKVPGLGDLPLLGALFQKEKTTTSKSNLAIFVTPKILVLGEKSEYERNLDALRAKLSAVPGAPVAKPVEQTSANPTTLGGE